MMKMTGTSGLKKGALSGKKLSGGGKSMGGGIKTTLFKDRVVGGKGR